MLMHRTEVDFVKKVITFSDLLRTANLIFADCIIMADVSSQCVAFDPSSNPQSLLDADKLLCLLPQVFKVI